MRLKRFAATVSGLLAVTLLAACGSGNEADDGVQTIRVATLNLCNEYNLFWAQETGLFEAHDLEVELIPSGGGSASISALVSGAADIAFANGLTAVLSTAKGVPVVYVANGYDSAVPPLPPSNGVWVTTDSPIRQPADLTGKTVAVNELGGINEFVTREWLDRKGVDPDSVKFVALPFPQMTNAAIAGNIDSFQATLAGVAGAPEGSIRSIGDPFGELGESLLYSGYLMTEQAFGENGDAAERFFEALTQAHQQTSQKKNRQRSYEITSKYCKSPVESIPDALGLQFRVTVSLTSLGVAADILVNNGQIDDRPDLENMVAEFARVD